MPIDKAVLKKRTKLLYRKHTILQENGERRCCYCDFCPRGQHEIRMMFGYHLREHHYEQVQEELEKPLSWEGKAS